MQFSCGLLKIRVFFVFKLCFPLYINTYSSCPHVSIVFSKDGGLAVPELLSLSILHELLVQLTHEINCLLLVVEIFGGIHN
jgi:hypothetical protein